MSASMMIYDQDGKRHANVSKSEAKEMARKPSRLVAARASSLPASVWSRLSLY
jgi:hypothetical protein